VLPFKIELYYLHIFLSYSFILYDHFVLQYNGFLFHVDAGHYDLLKSTVQSDEVFVIVQGIVQTVILTNNFA